MVTNRIKEKFRVVEDWERYHDGYSVKEKPRLERKWAYDADLIIRLENEWAIKDLLVKTKDRVAEEETSKHDRLKLSKLLKLNIINMYTEYLLKVKYVKGESSLSSDYIKQEEETYKIFLD